MSKFWKKTMGLFFPFTQILSKEAFLIKTNIQYFEYSWSSFVIKNQKNRFSGEDKKIIFAPALNFFSITGEQEFFWKNRPLAFLHPLSAFITLSICVKKFFTKSCHRQSVKQRVGHNFIGSPAKHGGISWLTKVLESYFQTKILPEVWKQLSTRKKSKPTDKW